MRKKGAPVTSVSSQKPATGGTGTGVGPSAETIRCSRPTSWAEAMTECNGGRGSAHPPPAASGTLKGRVERPPAVSSKAGGGGPPAAVFPEQGGALFGPVTPGA